MQREKETERVKERWDGEHETESVKRKERKEKKIVVACYSEVFEIKSHYNKLLNFLRFGTLDKEGFL